MAWQIKTFEQLNDYNLAKIVSGSKDSNCRTLQYGDKLNELVSNGVLDVFVRVYSFLCIWSTDYLGHSNITLATFEKMSDGSYIIKPIKQKQMVW